MFDMKLFVDTDPDTRLSRRVLRDTHEWKRDLETVLHQYTTYVKPAFEEFCLPVCTESPMVDFPLPKLYYIYGGVAFSRWSKQT